jgi:hypothetical protein
MAAIATSVATANTGGPEGERTWTALCAGVDNIMNHLDRGISYQHYMELYTCAPSRSQ